MKQRFLRAYARKLSEEEGRRVGVDEAEADITRTIETVARNLAPTFVFGYHTAEDIRQQAALIALQVLDGETKYDVGRPLENFLYVHVKRRLGNFLRDNFFRSEPPCGCCDAFGNPADPCRRWLDWSRRNAAKQALMKSYEAAADDTCSPEDVVSEASLRDVLARLDAGLPAELRSDYLRMLGRVPVPRARRSRVREAVRSILEAA